MLRRMAVVCGCTILVSGCMPVAITPGFAAKVIDGPVLLHSNLCGHWGGHTYAYVVQGERHIFWTATLHKWEEREDVPRRSSANTRCLAPVACLRFIRSPSKTRTCTMPSSRCCSARRMAICTCWSAAITPLTTLYSRLGASGTTGAPVPRM